MAAKLPESLRHTIVIGEQRFTDHPVLGRLRRGAQLIENRSQTIGHKPQLTELSIRCLQPVEPVSLEKP